MVGASRAYAPGRGMAEAFGFGSRRCSDPMAWSSMIRPIPRPKPLARDIFIARDRRARARPRSTAATCRRSTRRARVSRTGHAARRHDLALPSQSPRASHPAEGDQAFVGERVIDPGGPCRRRNAHPEHFSPNVLLRPLVQDTIFPTICYVAGPNELAYLGQLKDVYAHFGIADAADVSAGHRDAGDSATLRFLSKYGLPLTALQRSGRNGAEPAAREPAAADRRAGADRRLRRWSTSGWRRSPRRCRRSIRRSRARSQSTLGKMQHEMQTLHNKVIQAAKRKDETLRRQFQRAQALTFPQGHPQEREVGFVWFLNRYGPALVDRLMDDLPLAMGHHWVLTI